MLVPALANATSPAEALASVGAATAPGLWALLNASTTPYPAAFSALGLDSLAPPAKLLPLKVHDKVISA